MNSHVVLFDSVCGLCDRMVRFLLKIDRAGVLTFAPLQGPTAAAVLARHPALEQARESLVFVENYNEANEQVSTESTGVLRIFASVGGIWRSLSWLRVIPVFLRNAVYAWVARNRYRWFGRFDQCAIPSADVRVRFLP